MTTVSINVTPDTAAWIEAHREEATRLVAAAIEGHLDDHPAWPTEQARLAFRTRMQERLVSRSTPERVAAADAWLAEHSG